MKPRYLLFILLLFPFAVYCQGYYRFAESIIKVQVNAASVIRITPSTPISIYITPTVAGSASANATNSDSYLKATSIVAWSERKKVEAIISSGNVPTGTLLKLKASACTTGSGNFGNVTSQITLNKTSNQKIIDYIGSCYTGSGATDGYNLTYSWVLDPNNSSQLSSNSTTAAFITFTISTR
jgi:hypothetical protein